MVEAKTKSQWIREGWSEREILTFSRVGLVLEDPPAKSGTGLFIAPEMEKVVVESLQDFISKNENLKEMHDWVELASELYYALQNDSFLLLTTETPDSDPEIPD